MSGRLLFSLLPVAFAAIPYQKPIIPPTSAASTVQIQRPFEPNTESATSNANLIFNSIHSSMRQWGSSLQHNGMSFYPALVPEGTTLYHGTSKAERQTGAEWLAFEIEHAEVFARGGGGGGGGRRPGGPPGEGGPPSEGPPPDMLDDKDHEGPGGPGGPWGREPGYLHVYRTNRPMNRYLYVDGMSAGKSQLGTMDTQDYVLLNNHTGGGERERAKELCKLGEEWNVDGFIRMEAGFEIIHCNFTDGLDFVSHNKRPVQDEPEGYNDMGQFGWIRAVASRYDGIGGGRVQLDYSSMVSAFFYPLNLTNPDPDPLRNLPRLSSSSTEELARIKSDLKTVMTSSRLDHSITNWQGVVDMIVARYSDRLQFMATRPPLKTFLSEINNLLNLYIDYDSPFIKSSIQTCTSHYIPTLNRHTSTPTDHLLHAAISTVTQKICTSLFRIREDLLEKTGGLPENDLSGPLESIHIIRELNEWLDWTTFKACGNCGYDHVCYVAIWPFGSKEDHYNPSCKNATEIANGRGGEGYWGGPGGGPGGRRPGKGGPPRNGSPPALADL